MAHQLGGEGITPAPVDRRRLEKHQWRRLDLLGYSTPQDGLKRGRSRKIRNPDVGIALIGHPDVKMTAHRMIGDQRVVDAALHGPQYPEIARVLGDMPLSAEVWNMEDDGVSLGSPRRIAGQLADDIGCGFPRPLTEEGVAEEDERPPFPAIRLPHGHLPPDRPSDSRKSSRPGQALRPLRPNCRPPPVAGCPQDRRFPEPRPSR